LKRMMASASCNECLDQTNSMRVIKCRLEISSSARLLQKYTFLAKKDGTAELYRGKCKNIKRRIPFSSSVQALLARAWTCVCSHPQHCFVL
uniref:Uncharacterized protein n=1 Tax=Malurus cyaneus samueli TaxID=2593467 RepID=A0A8C5UBR1_9PASS